ncbi:MAG: RNA methyltransferase [Rhodothermales bacterium]
MDSVTEKRRRLLGASSYSPLDAHRFTFGDRSFSPEEIVDRLAPYLTDERAARIDEVLDGRTHRLATVVEGLVNMGNVSAVMRSAEALGCQPFHVITGGATFKNSRRTSQGAEKWLDVYRWATPGDCVAYLHDEGYRIVATHLDDSSVSIDSVDFSEPTAVVFGNERDGVSAEMVSLADERAIVPMVGFVQSFNISVAAAVTLYHAYRDRKARLGRHGDLTSDERAALRAAFYLRSVRAAENILCASAAEMSD